MLVTGARQASAQLASGETVAIGTLVTYQRDNQSRTVEIVGHDESDPASARIGFNAPLIRAMLGAELGDEIEFTSAEVRRCALPVWPAQDDAFMPST